MTEKTVSQKQQDPDKAAEIQAVNAGMALAGLGMATIGFKKADSTWGAVVIPKGQRYQVEDYILDPDANTDQK